ncbi:hypothetical protein [Coleofasciculus sp. E2-BRE-01]
MVFPRCICYKRADWDWGERDRSTPAHDSMSGRVIPQRKITA